ncbi:universal stress protein [Arthrobacter sp. Hiyo1]|uniref:universal stress protein n=1 Tax=Arthrobacter sp. Hiyo1 TaxID=1588020 RepID=UPI000A02662F|nr:universal stress protein [Arthrobacter sp. Hiyo1]
MARQTGQDKIMLLGSVSAACVVHAHCPVLVVHEPEAAEHPEPPSRPSRGGHQIAQTDQRSTI